MDAMADDFDELWKKVRAVDEAEFIRILAKILSSKEGRTFIFNLEPLDAALCIEILDHGLALHKLRGSEKQTFFVTLRRLAGKHARLPESMVITDKIDYSVPGHLQTSGGFADIKPGLYNGCIIAVKALRVALTDDFVKIRKQFCKEAILWNSLSHPNVLELVGVVGDMEKYQFATVSEWMVHGNIMEYIRKNDTNRLELLRGTAEGLKYLHEANIIHGDLKGANILMTNDTPPKACLADFGFTTMVLDPQYPMSSSFTLEGGTLAFMAPELLAPSKHGLRGAFPTREGDVYAFGLVILQVLTGEQPFRGVKLTEHTLNISSGLRPDKPEDAETIGISESLWKLIQKCWDGEKTRRPRIQEVVEGVADAAANWHVLAPPSVVKHEEDTIEKESKSLEHTGIFRAYVSEGIPAVDSGTNTSAHTSTDTRQSSNAHTISTQQTEVETHEEDAEIVYKHLNQDNPSPPTALPQRKRKGFKAFEFFGKVFGRKQKQKY